MQQSGWELGQDACGGRGKRYVQFLWHWGNELVVGSDSLASKRGQSGWAGLGLVAGYSGQIGGSGGADAASGLPRWLDRPTAVVVWCAALLGA